MKSPACHICGGALRTRFGAVPDARTGATFEIEECTACGLGQTVTRSDDPGRFYGAGYHGGRHGASAAYCARRRLKLVTRVAGPGAGRRLLDIGCGDGTFMLAARVSGWRVVGTELNPRAARDAGLEVYESSERALEFAPFHCITLWHSLEHLPAPAALLKSLARSLAPGGSLVVAVPDAQGLQASVFRSGWFHLDVPRHLYHFGRRSLALLLEASGFDITRRWHQEFEYDLLGWSQSALNAVLPAPNLFFDILTGRGGGSGRAARTANCILGAFFMSLALPLTAAGTLARRGGTLVVAARRKERD
jgi:SAM-dependent methyltransferase